jgi:hypothetical protein
MVFCLLPFQSGTRRRRPARLAGQHDIPANQRPWRIARGSSADRLQLPLSGPGSPAVKKPHHLCQRISAVSAGTCTPGRAGRTRTV